MPIAPKFLNLLRALASGECASDLWYFAAVEHYSHAASENARVQLVRVASEAGEWHWPNVPVVLREKACELLNEFSGGE
jgi:hypothetical protein